MRGKLAVMKSFHSVDEIKERIKGPVPYSEFIRIPSMSCGIYVLQPEEKDFQRPHNEDEIYYVIRGAARIKVTAKNEPEQDRAIGPGDIIFVKAHEEHRFVDVVQELVLLVVFAPAMT
jgi:mannose-6-phosphate isomerase-like protein (cupin superfamily)